jgi:hypothetical protein
MRLGDIANQNNALLEDVKLYDEKLISKTKYIDELKERNRNNKNEIEDLEKLQTD